MQVDAGGRLLFIIAQKIIIADNFEVTTFYTLLHDQGGCMLQRKYSRWTVKLVPVTLVLAVHEQGWA